MATDDKKVSMFPIMPGQEEHEAVRTMHGGAPKAAMIGHALAARGFRHMAAEEGGQAGDEEGVHHYMNGEHSMMVHDSGKWEHHPDSSGDMTEENAHKTGKGHESLVDHLKSYSAPTETSDVRQDIMKAKQGMKLPDDRAKKTT